MDKRCNNKEPHDFHSYAADVAMNCSGLTACGKLDHNSHSFVITQYFWCHGICDCGMRSSLTVHGPGSHK